MGCLGDAGQEKERSIPAVLTVAGSDCSGGAGIQADLKTMAACGVYGMSVITAVTAQNTCGVQGVENVSGEMLRLQLRAVWEDIPPAAVKIGMLSTPEAVQAVADWMEQYQPPHVVLDPVLVSTSGRSLLSEEARASMLERLFPAVELVTPNLPEAEQILGYEISDTASMEYAAAQLGERYGCAVLLKGGHLKGRADDLLFSGRAIWYPSGRIEAANTHGTGCTLSSAIASGLAWGRELPEAVAAAKEYVRGAMSTGLNLGQGNGPLDHGWRSWRTDRMRWDPAGTDTFVGESVPANVFGRR